MRNQFYFFCFICFWCGCLFLSTCAVPEIQIGILASSYSAEVGDSIEFFASKTSMDSYQWKLNDDFVGNCALQPVCMVTFTEVGLATMRLRVSKELQNETQTISALKTDEAKALVTITPMTLTIYASSSVVVPGEKVTLTASRPGMNSYLWTVNGTVYEACNNLYLCELSFKRPGTVSIALTVTQDLLPIGGIELKKVSAKNHIELAVSETR